MEQLLTSVTLSVLAPLPGRKENIRRVCLCALAGSVTLSFAFFSIFESFNTNRTDLSTGIRLLQAVLTSTLVCQQRTLRRFAFCLPPIVFSSKKQMQGQRRCDTLMYFSEQASCRPSEFRECRARICSQPNSGLWFWVRCQSLICSALQAIYVLFHNSFFPIKQQNLEFRLKNLVPVILSLTND